MRLILRHPLYFLFAVLLSASNAPFTFVNSANIRTNTSVLFRLMTCVFTFLEDFSVSSLSLLSFASSEPGTIPSPGAPCCVYYSVVRTPRAYLFFSYLFLRVLFFSAVHLYSAFHRGSSPFGGPFLPNINLLAFFNPPPLPPPFPPPRHTASPPLLFMVF